MSPSPKHKSPSKTSRQPKREKSITLKDRNEDTRLALIKAAIDVFGEKGLEGATVKDISERAGVNNALISYYFGGKEKLYEQCFQHHGQEKLKFAQGLLRAPESAEDMRVRLKMLVEAILEGHVTEPGMHKMIHRELETNLKHAREVIMASFIKIFEMMIGFFESAKKSKIIRSEIDPYLAATIFHSAILQIARSEQIRCDLHKISITDEKVRRRIADQMIEIFFNGIVRGES